MNHTAFPNSNETSGMNIREYLVGQCIGDVIRQCAGDMSYYQGNLTAEEYFADKAVTIADAIIERLKK